MNAFLLALSIGLMVFLCSCNLGGGELLGEVPRSEQKTIVQEYNVCDAKAVKLTSEAPVAGCATPNGLENLIDSISVSGNKLRIVFVAITGEQLPQITRLSFSHSEYNYSYSGYTEVERVGNCQEDQAVASGKRAYECVLPYTSGVSGEHFLARLDLKNEACGSTATFQAVFPHPACQNSKSYSWVDKVYIGKTAVDGIYATYSP